MKSIVVTSLALCDCVVRRDVSPKLTTLAPRKKGGGFLAEIGPKDPGTPQGKADRRLTKRQADVVVLLSQDLRYKAIGAKLGISRRTVEDVFAAARVVLGTEGVGDTVLEARRTRQLGR